MDKAQKREYGYPCTLGVGSGDGQLFVHGTYESIKAAQAIILERDALKADNERMREALNIIASWREGPRVTSSFDEPGSAEIARQALKGGGNESL